MMNIISIFYDQTLTVVNIPDMELWNKWSCTLYIIGTWVRRYEGMIANA